MIVGNIKPEDFLTDSTNKGLQVTIQSTIDLSKHLLENCNFEYVLTAKICQDPLEVNVLFCIKLLLAYQIAKLINSCYITEIFWYYKAGVWS